MVPREPCLREAAEVNPVTGRMLEKMCPFFIVSGVDRSVAFYRDKLGFESWHQQPEGEPFFAILGRDGAMLFIKSGRAEPLPNNARDAEMRWDAYVVANDPDALAAEFVSRGVGFSVPLGDTHDGLRGFEVTDPDGYVLFFGRPREGRAGSS
jgi:catechol 2,3-dioxygenase-like lactoylglutathione lyase family enzyme